MSRALVEFDDLSSLHDKIKQLPGIAENAINNVLHSEGIKIVTEEMTNLIPVSTWRTKDGLRGNTKRNKRHAKDSKWSKSEQFNLGFIVKTRGGAAKNKGSFGYLVFPDEGRGNLNPVEQDFSGRAARIASRKILEKLHGTLDQILEF